MDERMNQSILWTWFLQMVQTVVELFISSVSGVVPLQLIGLCYKAYYPSLEFHLYM